MDLRPFVLLLIILTILLFLPHIPHDFDDLLSSRSILLALLSILALIFFSAQLFRSRYPSLHRLTAMNAVIIATLFSSVPVLLSCQKISTFQKIYALMPYALLSLSILLIDYIVLFVPPRCPNCGHEMIKIGETFVCPECEYHSDVDPEKGTFR